jgi:predicted nucleic acid-binding protein
MTLTLVDSNVVIDLLEVRQPWRDWAEERMSVLSEDGALIINQIIFGEISVPYPDYELLDQALRKVAFAREDLPWEACFRAAKAFLVYRKIGGPREKILPDFFIGAHAAVNGHRILSRDGARYRTYFPEVEVIAPDTHP